MQVGVERVAHLFPTSARGFLFFFPQWKEIPDLVGCSILSLVVEPTHPPPRPCPSTGRTDHRLAGAARTASVFTGVNWFVIESKSWWCPCGKGCLWMVARGWHKYHQNTRIPSSFLPFGVKRLPWSAWTNDGFHGPPEDCLPPPWEMWPDRQSYIQR